MFILDPDGFIIRLVEQTTNILDIYTLLISFYGLGYGRTGMTCYILKKCL